MPDRSDQYRFKATDKLTAEALNGRVLDINSRLLGVEVQRMSEDEAFGLVLDRVLQRSENVIASLRDQLVAITELSWLTARSATPRTLAGEAEFFLTILEDDRPLFAPGPFAVLTREATPNDYAVVRTLGWNRENGRWDVRVESFTGAPGPHDDWQATAIAGSTLSQLALLSEAKADRQAVEVNAEDVAADRLAVEAAATQVETKRASVAEMHGAVVAAAETVAEAAAVTEAAVEATLGAQAVVDSADEVFAARDVATAAQHAAAVSQAIAAQQADAFEAAGIEGGDDFALTVISDPTGMLSNPVTATLDDENNVAQALLRDGSSFVMKLLVATIIQMKQGGVDARHLLNYDWAVADDNDDVGAAIDNLTKRFLAPFGVEIQDVYFTATRVGYLLAAVRKSTNALLFGINTTGKLIADIDLDLGDAIDFTTAAVETGAFNYDWAVANDDGDVAIGVKDGVLLLPSYIQPASSYDAENLTRSAAYKSRAVTALQKPTATFNLFVVTGQSLGQGDEAWPALSRTNQFGNLMIGTNVLPNTDGASFTAFTDSAFHDLVAVTVSGSTVYADDPATESGAPAGRRGEPINHGWANGAKFRLNSYFVSENVTERKFVSVNVAKSGATIGELEKTHTEGSAEYYARYSQALTLFVAAAGASTKVVTAIGFLQGEHDYANASGHTSLNLTYALYKAKLIDYAADMQADAMTATGQTKPPVFLTYQTGAAYTRDADVNGLPGLHIGMAQLDFTNASPTAFMVSPVYPYTDKGGHLDSNGSRWLGHQFGKVFHAVAVQGRDWSPLRPLRFRKVGLAVYIDFHVPEPPLVFDMPYVVATATSYAAKGFKVTDDDGVVPISAVELAGQTIVKITLGREIEGDGYVWYADKTVHNGNGMLRDSDPALASDNYVYEPLKGMYTSANIAALVDKPYPLHNWCVAFYLPLTHSEI